MLSLAGIEVLAKLGLKGSRLKQNKYICSIFLHTVERMQRLTIIYWISSNLITFSNLKQHCLHIKSLTIQQASQQYSLELYLFIASDYHSHYARFVSNLNLHRPQINNYYGAATFPFIASKMWETIPLELKKLRYYRFSKHFKLYLSFTFYNNLL